MSFNRRFYATVNSTTSFSCVVSNWAGFAVTYCGDAARSHAVFNQDLLNSVSTTLGQLLVVGVWTYGVSVTSNFYVGSWVLSHEVGQVFHVAVAVRLNNGLVEVELDVQLNTNNLSNWSFWLWSWLWSWSWGRSWSDCASVTAEVYAQANQRGVVPLAVVQTVVSFNTGTSVQVVGEVVLHASTNGSESSLVATAVAVSLNVGTALVTETAFYVWTQAVYASLTEVILGNQAAGIAFDLLVTSTVVRTGVVGLVVGQVQGQVVGQEVTDASARIEAVFDVLDAIVVLLLVEQLAFNCALALCQNAERSSGNKRTNGQAQGVFQFHPLNPHLVIVKQSHKPGDNSATSLTELAYT